MLIFETIIYAIFWAIHATKLFFLLHIVQSLIDDNTNELADELTRNEGLCLDDSFMADDLNDPDELGMFPFKVSVKNNVFYFFAWGNISKKIV